MGEVNRRGRIKRCFRIEVDSHQCLTACEWKIRGKVEKCLHTGKGCLNPRPNHATH